MRIRTFPALAALAAAMAFLPATAQAEPSPEHCVVDLSAKGSMSCFATFTEVVATVTGGRVTTAPDDAHRAMDDPAFVSDLEEQAAAAGEYILSIEYEHIDYDGSSLTAVGDHPCSGSRDDVDYWLPSMPGGWDNRISSYYYGNGQCWVRHYTDPDFHGGWTRYRGFDPDMRDACDMPGCYQTSMT